MKNFALLVTGLACSLVSSVTSLAIQCKVDFDDMFPSNRITCVPAGVVTFKGGAKVPLYSVDGIIIKPLRNHHPYINFYLPRNLAHNFIVLYDNDFELIPKDYTHIGIISNMHTFGIIYTNPNATGCVGRGITGGIVSAYCSNAIWFHDSKDIRYCGEAIKGFSDLQSNKKNIKVLRKDYRHKTVLAEANEKNAYYFVNEPCGYHLSPNNLENDSNFGIIQGTDRPHITLPEEQRGLRGLNEAEVAMPKNQENLARILANYYYYMYTH